MAGGPLDGNALILAAAKASVSGERLPDLIDSLQRTLRSRLPEYGRHYECVYEDDEQAVFLAEEGHWETLGEELELNDREWKAARRAHKEHLRRLGSELDRRQEFETALDLREPVVIGKETP
ncbi:MAG: hypothetical protein ACI80F_002693 [Natronomonas sp.]|jgi:hypothetical protein|uniref:hypothetical protein n=1 Tax=Natronomonas sp. TaxID=2184060 RepID=UPI0039897099